MKPICVKCKRFFRPKKNGTYFIEGMPTVTNAMPGLAEPENWKPYKLWVGDIWHCPTCSAEIIVGVCHSPLSEHYLPNFDKAVAELGAKLQINDC